MRVLLLLLFIVLPALASAQVLRIEYPVDFKTSQGDAVLVFDVTQGGAMVTSALLRVGDMRDLHLSAGTYSIVATGYTTISRTTATGTASSSSFSVSAGEVVNRVLFIAATGVPTHLVGLTMSPAVSGGTAAGGSVLFLCVTAGFIFGWCLLSPLEL
jgi:hypothetical protein